MQSAYIYDQSETVSKSNTVDFLQFSATNGRLTDALFVGGAGDVVAVFQDGSAITFVGVPANTTLPLALRRVNSTNTTARITLATSWLDQKPARAENR